MKRLLTIAKATALEILSEPLSLLLCLSALALAILAPTLHYHQFGDVERMARDAGLSALFLGGTVHLVFGCVRSLRRELESGTAALAFAHAISRPQFLLSKFLGALAAYAVFALTVTAVALAMVAGMQAGGRIAEATGDIARVARPMLAAAAAVAVVAPVAAALLNRFFRFRFAYTANLLLLAFSLVAAAVTADSATIVRMAPVAALTALPAVFVASVAFAAAVRLRLNAAIACGAVAFAAQIPFFGSYYLPEVLAKGGALPPLYAVLAVAALLPAVVAALLVASVDG